MNIRVLICVVGIFMAAFPLNAFGAGACCDGVEIGLCFEANDQFDCTEGGDETWMGEGTTCDPNPCLQGPGSQAIPTLNEWGMIIFMILAGAGAVFYMRKQRRAKE